MKKRVKKRLAIFLEFFIFGILMGIVEDLIAISLTTGESLTWKMVGIAAAVTLPFAIIGELIVDRINLFRKQ